MSAHCSAFEYQDFDGDGSLEPLALRTVDQPIQQGRLYIPRGSDETCYESVVRAVEMQTRGRVGEVIPIDDEKVESVCGVKASRTNPDSSHNGHDSGIWVAYHTAPYDPTLERPPERDGAADWRYVYVKQGLRPDDPRTMIADQWSLCIIKPDAKEMGLEADIWDRISVDGLKVVASLDSIRLQEDNLDQIWPSVDDNGSPLPPNAWWGETVKYMTSGPVDTLLVYGSNASTIMKSLKNQLRAEQYGEGHKDDQSLRVAERVKSVIHTSDCDRELALNVLGFWKRNELARFANQAVLLDRT